MEKYFELKISKRILVSIGGIILVAILFYLNFLTLKYIWTNLNINDLLNHPPAHLKNPMEVASFIAPLLLAYFLIDGAIILFASGFKKLKPSSEEGLINVILSANSICLGAALFMAGLAALTGGNFILYLIGWIIIINALGVFLKLIYGLIYELR